MVVEPSSPHFSRDYLSDFVSEADEPASDTHTGRIVYLINLVNANSCFGLDLKLRGGDI